MKHLSYFSALLFALTLSACGGGGGGTSADTGASSTTQQSPIAPSTTSGQSGSVAPQTLTSVSQVIEYHGDSTVWGLKSGTQDNPVQVSKPAPVAFLEALPSSPSQQVRNKGVTGTTACDLLNGRPQLGIDTDWQTQMASSNATVVIINHGINDLVTGESISVYKDCLTNLAKIAKGRGKTVIFETPNPVDRQGLDTYVAAMKDVALLQNNSVIDQFENLNKSLSTRTIRDIVPDGTHPSDQVYIDKGQFAASVFKTLPR